MKKKSLLIIAVLAVIAVLYFAFGRKTVENADADIVVSAKKGEFVIDITTTGELEAKNSVKIMAPQGLRRAHIWEIKIAKLEEEGSMVKKGDVVAVLDNSTINDRINELQNELEQRESDYSKAKLDTAISLRKLRDELINKEYAVEEKRLVVEQSEFEPPATQQQNDINLEKAIRELQQAKENYELEKNKAIAEVRKARSRYREEKMDLDFLQGLLKDLVIKTPEPGMLEYAKSFNGQKMKEGDILRLWNPVLAELPDLSKMISRTYVNEVDIRRVKEGQVVNISLDAYPEKRLTGNVIKVANIGEQKPNSDAKVFQVDIEVNEADTTLRPGMTTGNQIVADVEKNVISVPLEALHNQGDSISYVFKKNGLNMVKQQVQVGKTNSNEAIIHQGIIEDDEILLSIPENADKKKLVLLEKMSDKEEAQPLTSIK
jgi:HlyD family secretion protein